MNNRATVGTLREILGDGRFGTITFQKVDGSIRRLNGRIGVSKGVNGNGFSSPNVVKVYDVQRDENGLVKGWRTVKPEKVMQIVANKRTYDFIKRDVDPVPFITDVFRKGEELYVRMNKDSVYRYFGVPLDLMKDFAVAENRGHFFNEKIKGHFGYDRVR